MAEKVKACIQASKYLDENSRYEMLDVLTHLEGELQAKDVTIAALKSECLKHVIYSIQSSNKSGDILTDPVFALGRDAVNVASGPIPPSQSGSSSKNQVNNKDAASGGSLQAVLNKESDAVSQHVAHKIKVLQTLVDAQKSALKKLTTCLREAESQKAELTKDLEEQKRKLEQEVSKNEAALNSSKSDQNPSAANQGEVKSSEERVKLESQIEELQKKLAEEATAKKQITLLLLEDRKKMATLYLEEKKRSEDLNHLLREEKSKVHSLGIGLEEESQRSLAMEAELERYLVQINGQAEELAAARATRQDLEDALRRARADSDHFKKQLTEAHRVAMSQASVAASLVPVMPHNPAQAFSDGPSTLSNMDGNNPASSSGSYGKWNVCSSATLPSSSAGVLASSSATSAAATLAVGSMTLGSTSQHQSAQSKGVAAVYDKEGHIMGSRQTQEYSSSATMVPRQHRTGIGGLNTPGQPGSSSSGSKSDMSSSSMASSSSVLSSYSFSGVNHAKHMLSAHNTNTSFVCGIGFNPCTEYVESLEAFEKHREQFHPDEMEKRTNKKRVVVTCEVCGKTSRGDLFHAKHMLTQHGIKIEMMCKICNLQCESVRTLERHRKEVHCAASCPYCGKQFSQSEYLTAHLKTHEEKNAQTYSYMCEVCSQAFSNPNYLKIHMKKHQEKTIQCTMCPKMFRWESSLTGHMAAAHNAGKALNLKCEYCGKQFADKSNLKNHRYTHTTEKPHHCGVCGRGYIRRDLMMTHQRNCTAVKQDLSNQQQPPSQIHPGEVAQMPQLFQSRSQSPAHHHQQFNQ